MEILHDAAGVTFSSTDRGCSLALGCGCSSALNCGGDLVMDLGNFFQHLVSAVPFRLSCGKFAWRWGSGLHGKQSKIVGTELSA